MSRVNLPPLDRASSPTAHIADILDALLTMIELCLAAKEDKIDRADILAVRDRIDHIRAAAPEDKS